MAIIFIAGSLALQKGYAEEGFFKPVVDSGHGLSLDVLEKAVSSSYLIQTSSGELCSINILSPDGYALTALHCLSSQLVDKGLAKFETQSVQGTEMATLEVDPSLITRPNHISFLMGQSQDTLVPVKALVVLSGERLTYMGDEKDHISPLPTFKEHTLKKNEDYILLQIISQDQSYPCIPLVSLTKPEKQEAVWSIGFPDRAWRSNNQNSDGISQYITHGNIGFNFDNVQWVSELFGVSDPEIILPIHQVMSDYLIGSQGFISDLDSISGMSGAMVINSSGELIGIQTSGFLEDPSLFTPFTALGLKIQWISQQISERLGKSYLEKITCK